MASKPRLLCVCLLTLIASGCPTLTLPTTEPDPYVFSDYWPMAIGNSWTFAEKTPHNGFDTFADELSYKVVASSTVNAYTVWHLKRKDLLSNTSTTFYVVDVDGVLYTSDDLADFDNLPTLGSGAVAIQASEYPKAINVLSPISTLVQDFDLYYTTGRLKDIGDIVFLGASQDQDQPFELNDIPVDENVWVVHTHDAEDRVVNGQVVPVDFTRTLFAWGVGPLFDVIHSREIGPVHARVLSQATVGGVRYKR